MRYRFAFKSIYASVFGLALAVVWPTRSQAQDPVPSHEPIERSQHKRFHHWCCFQPHREVFPRTYATNGLGVPGAGQATDWYDLAGLLGTSGSLNNAMAYGGRVGLWLPSRGINFGVSELVNVPYGKNDGALISDWQPYFNYHRGNWDARFEYGQNYERTQQFIGSNINRTGLYAQLAYRDYQSIHKHIQRLEYVFRYSEAAFQGIDLAKFDPTSFNPLTNAPVNRSQYTAGLNYYFYPSTILKFAYEINTERGLNLMDNLFMVQFATNF